MKKKTVKREFSEAEREEILKNLQEKKEKKHKKEEKKEEEVLVFIEEQFEEEIQKELKEKKELKEVFLSSDDDDDDMIEMDHLPPFEPRDYYFIPLDKRLGWMFIKDVDEELLE